MMELVFATNNANKIREIQKKLGEKYRFLSLSDINCTVELPETSDTLEGNALEKADYVFEHFGKNCFSEDTGLEVALLDGAPGVYTARYAGSERDSTANMQKLLAALEGKKDRSARFRTVIALIIHGDEFLFEGIVNGKIATAMSGTDGFGYDPVFIPEGHEVTFAEMTVDEKNNISHRARAVAKLQDYLQKSGWTTA